MKVTIKQFAPVTQEGLQKVEAALFEGKHTEMNANEVALLLGWITWGGNGYGTDFPWQKQDTHPGFCIKCSRFFTVCCGDTDYLDGEYLSGLDKKGIERKLIPHTCNGNPLRHSDYGAEYLKTEGESILPCVCDGSGGQCACYYFDGNDNQQSTKVPSKPRKAA